ncbi:MAG: hypothetical protein ACTSUE_03735 [Promethearchaeota archaeon]
MTTHELYKSKEEKKAMDRENTKRKRAMDTHEDQLEMTFDLWVKETNPDLVKVSPKLYRSYIKTESPACKICKSKKCGSTYAFISAHGITGIINDLKANEITLLRDCEKPLKIKDVELSNIQQHDIIHRAISESTTDSNTFAYYINLQTVCRLPGSVGPTLVNVVIHCFITLNELERAYITEAPTKVEGHRRRIEVGFCFSDCDGEDCPVSDE